MHFDYYFIQRKAKYMKVQRLIRQKSVLLVCDIQQKLIGIMDGYKGLLQASSVFIKAAKTLGLPIIVTEQNKKAIGSTCQDIRKLFTEQEKQNFYEKMSFTMLTPQVCSVLQKYPQRKQVILIGMDAQVCVLQTCLDLLQKNYEVFLPVDCISSARAWERNIALQRMSKSGAILTGTQSAIFEMLKNAKDQKFKEILPLIKDLKKSNSFGHL